VKKYNRAYGTCEALEELLMGFFPWHLGQGALKV